jgi:flagellar basal body-associated protein FliL
VLITVEETDDGKSWIDTYGIPLGIIVALIVAAMVAVLVMKGKKGGKTPSSTEVEGQPMAAESEEQPAPPADEQ